jgi:hypothetical protein
LALLIGFPILRWYISKDDQDLAIKGLELLSRVVRGDGCADDLKREVIRRCVSVYQTTVGRNKRSTELLEYTALVCGVVGVLIEVAPAASTILGLGSRFELDLALHVA